jgi:hypothetical protein
VAGAATMPTADGVTTPGDEVVYGDAAVAAPGELAKRRWSASGARRRGLTRGGNYLRLGNGRGPSMAAQASRALKGGRWPDRGCPAQRGKEAGGEPGLGRGAGRG